MTEDWERAAEQPQSDAGEAPESAFIFHGTWKEFAPIAFTNLLLTIVTLGIYRFWATTRERRYLWSQSQFIDERLEWTGTGMELLRGFLFVLLLFGPPLLFLQFGVQALSLQGYPGTAFLLTFVSFIMIFYLTGVARFRALRYRLGRTYWHGIRGGGEGQGFKYGWSYIWKTVVGYIPGGLLIPWSMVELWNERWNQMSFGQHKIEASSDFTHLMMRFVLCYVVPSMLFFFGIFGLIFGMMAILGISEGAGFDPEDPELIGIFVGLVFLGIMLFYLVIGFAFLVYYAKFYRIVVAGMSLDTLDFSFSARTKDWFKLVLGDIGLVIVTLGVGYIFLGYRHWKFFITHMQATGEIDLERLTQSSTDRARHGEGLLDAFDLGAI